MEVAALSSNVSLANTGSTTGFTMEANAFSFRVMSDGLYQNKIGSMVREVTCNGLDSHTLAGWPERPVRVHLPDQFEPFFSVQDFGVGLDDKGVRVTFGTYFASTKRDDSAAIGAFGLGSKTPFAYTDAFTIVAIKDGKRRTYSCFINEAGLPDITNMGGEHSQHYILTYSNGTSVPVKDEWHDTEDADGVTVIVPVTSSNDFTRFRNEVRDQLSFFPVKPDVVNGVISWHEFDASQYMDFGRVMIGEGYGGHFGGLWVVMGPVGYKADVNLIKQSVSPDNSEFLDIIASRAILKFDLGAVEVQPSREGLSYSKRTIAAIEKLLDEARESMKADVQVRVDALGDAWATAVGLNTNSTLNRLARITKATFTADGYYRAGQWWMLDLEAIANLENAKGDGLKPKRNLDLDSTLTVAEEEEGEFDGDVEEDEEEEDGETLADTLRLQFRQYTRQKVSKRGRVKKWRESSVGRHVKPDKQVVVLVRDTANKPVVRIREFMSNLQSDNLQVYVLQTRDGGVVDAKDLDAIKARIGASWTPALMSEVDLPESERAGRRSGYKLPTGYLLGGYDALGNTKEWERCYEKLVDFGGAYYFIVERNETNAKHHDNVVQAMHKAGLLDRPVMAIRQRDADKLADNPDWIPVSVKTQEILDAVRDNKTLANARSLEYVRYYGVRLLDGDVERMLKEAAGAIPQDSPLHKLFRLSSLIGKAKARYQSRGYNSIVETAMSYANVELNYDWMQEALNNRGKKLVAAVNEAYPLLQHFRDANGCNVADQKRHILNYVANAGA